MHTGIDSLILLSCFYLALYALYIYFTINKWSGWSVFQKFLANVAVILPAVINLCWIGPAALKAASVVDGIQMIDESAIKVVLAKMDTAITYAANLREALRREYGVEQPQPHEKKWADRFRADDGSMDSRLEGTKFGTWFAVKGGKEFFEKVAASDEATLAAQLNERKHIDQAKDNTEMYYLHYPETPCPPSRGDGDMMPVRECLLDGMRDLLIADETARLILNIDYGLGEDRVLGAGAIKAAKVAQSNIVRTASKAVKGDADQGSSNVSSGSLWRFYKGEYTPNPHHNLVQPFLTDCL